MAEQGSTTQPEVPAAPPSLIDVDTPPPADDTKPLAADKAPPDATDENADPEKKSETPEQQEVRRKSRRERAIERATQSERDARIRAETELRILREQTTQQRQTQQQPGEPKREHFEDYETYLEARTDWRADQKVAAALENDRRTRQQTEQQHRQAADQQKLGQDWVKREQAFEKRTPDYADVVTRFVEENLSDYSPDARALIVESEAGPPLLYHLAHPDNAEDAERIAGLSPRRQIIELGKLEEKVSAQPQARTTKAPPPLEVVKGGKSASTEFSDNMSGDEFAAWAAKNGSRIFRKRS